jgi:hypothetical protein
VGLVAATGDDSADLSLSYERSHHRDVRRAAAGSDARAAKEWVSDQLKTRDLPEGERSRFRSRRRAALKRDLGISMEETEGMSESSSDEGGDSSMEGLEHRMHTAPNAASVPWYMDPAAPRAELEECREEEVEEDVGEVEGDGVHVGEEGVVPSSEPICKENPLRSME